MSFEPIRSKDLPPLPKIKQMAMLVDVKNYSQLDLYAQIILRELPEDPHANLACAWVAKQFNLEKKYSSYMEKSAFGDRAIEDIAHDLHIDIEELRDVSFHKKTNTDIQKYHLIKAWGYGFGSEMASLMSQAYLAEVTNREPVVDWGENFLYRSEGRDCAFHHYFKPFNALKVDSLPLADGDFYPPKWKTNTIAKGELEKRKGEFGRMSALHYFSRTEQITVADYYTGVVSIRPWVSENHPLLGMDLDQTYRYLANKYLKPQDELLNKSNDFIVKNLAEGFIAVHARGSDKDEGYRALKSIPRQTVEHAKKVLNQLPNKTKLFLMTDDMHLLKTYKEEFGSKLVFTDSQRSESETGVHYSTEGDKVAAGKEMLLDMLIAAKSKYFIGLGLSNPSQLIYYFGDFNNENYKLFGENRLKQFNTHLYKTIPVL